MPPGGYRPESPPKSAAGVKVHRRSAIGRKREPPWAFPDLSKLTLIGKADASSEQLVCGRRLVVAFVQEPLDPPRIECFHAVPNKVDVHLPPPLRDHPAAPPVDGVLDPTGRAPFTRQRLGCPYGFQEATHSVHTRKIREQPPADLPERRHVSTHGFVRQLRSPIHVASM